MKKRNVSRLLCFMLAALIAFILIPMNLETVYAGTIDLSTLSIFKNHYGAGATYDVQRNPAYPAGGTNQKFYKFTSGYYDKGNQTLSNGDYLQFSFVESTGSNVLLDDINNTGKKYAISLGLYSQNGTLKKEIANAGGVVFYGPSTEAGVIFCELNNFAGLLLTDKYYSNTDVLTYTPSIGKVTKLSELATYNAGSASDPKHVHGDWTYVLKNGTTDTIEASCGVTDSDCDLASNPVVTLNAVDAVYTGTSYANANMVDEITPIVGNGVVQKKYYSVDEDGHETSLIGAPTNVGSYKVEVTVGSGENIVTVEDSFAISAKSIEGEDINVAIAQDSYEYDGDTKTPSITVTDITRNVTLVEDTDYKISGTTSGSALSGENGYTITVTGIGNYEGTVNKTWRITKKLPEITELPTAASIIYGETLSESAMDGGKAKRGETVIEGTFEWKNPTVKPTVADGETTGYEVVFYPEDTEEYEPVTCNVTLTVSKKTAKLLWGDTRLTYNGKEQKPKAVVANLEDADKGKVTVSVSGDQINENTEAGYTATAISLAGDAAANYELSDTAENNQTTFKIYPKKLTAAMVNATTSYVFTDNTITPTISVKDGSYPLLKGTDYTLVGDISGKDVKNDYKLTVTGNGNYTGTVDVAWRITDAQPPTGMIKVSEHQWQELADSLSFDIRYKEKQNVTITATDEGSGVDKIYYFLTSSASRLERSALAALPESKWTLISNGGSFIINPDNKYVIYAKITDISGNVTFISSNGIILDKTAPVITGIENNKTYCSGVSFKVSDAIELASVEIDGLDRGTTGSYTIDATAEDTTHTIVAVDTTGNSVSYTITINAGGNHSFREDWTIIKNATCEEDGVRSHTCACGAVETEIISKLNHDYATDAHFVWTADKGADGVVNGYNATAYFVCNYDSNHIVNADSCAVVREVTTPATVGAEGVVTYTATATRGGITYTATKTTKQTRLTKLDNGVVGSNIYTSTSVASDAPKTTCGEELDETLAKKLMTQAEQADYNEPSVATDVTVYLEVQNITDTVTSGDKSKVETQIADLVTKEANTDADVVVVSGAAYVDLSMYKNVTTTVDDTVTSDTTTQITDAGTEITITMNVPEDIPPVASGFTRKYSVIRVHDGTAELLRTQQSGNQLTFKTSKFSTYAVSYVDVKNTSVTPPEENGGSWVSPSQPEKPKKDDPKDDEPKQEEETGDFESESGSTTVSMDTTFRKLHLAEAKATKNAVKVTWKKVTGADGYVIYGAPCNTKDKTYKIKKIAVIKNRSEITYTDKKLKSGTYYKYYIKAYKLVNGKKVWLAKSKTVHVTTTGGKYGNAKAVKVNKTNVTLKKGKSLVIKAQQITGAKVIQRHANIKFESSNTKISTVTKNGRIKAKKKGTCYIYVYAQNGVYKRIKVVVS